MARPRPGALEGTSPPSPRQRETAPSTSKWALVIGIAAVVVVFAVARRVPA